MALLKVTERVDFDPSDPQHRDAIRKFMVRRSWRDAGIWFNLDADYDNLVEQTYHQLVQWYFKQDAKVKKISQL